MKKSIQNDEGSIIASVVLVITLSSVLLIGLTYILENQVTQYHNIKNVYEAKSMLEVSEHIVNEQTEKEPIVSGGELQFSNGEVQVEILSADQIKMNATLTNGFTSSRYIPIDVKKSKENASDEQEADELKKERLSLIK